MRVVPLVLATATVLLASCGDDGEETVVPASDERAAVAEDEPGGTSDADDSTTDGSGTEADDDTAATRGDDDPDADSDAGADGEEAAGPATRTVEHRLGVSEVPADPQRIVVMDPGTILPTFVALGIPVVAAPLPDEPFPTALLSEDDLAGIASVGLPEVSFELVAAADPDLIIGFDVSMADAYDTLSQIAPTVGVEADLNDWRTTAERIAEAAGLDAEVAMAGALADYDDRVTALRASLGDAIDREVSIVRALGQNVRIHTRFHFAGQVLDEIGFPRPEAQRTDDPEIRQIQISLEELDLIDADVLFIFGAGRFGSLGGDEVDETVQEVLDHPLFPDLDVAASDAVVVVDPLGWQQGGLPAANLILDDIEAAFS